MSTYTPTEQQQDIINAVDDGYNIVVQALAGCGKTTTFEMIANHLADVDRGGRYIAFNRVTAQAAQDRFTRGNVETSTIHSLAYRIASRHNVTAPLIGKMRHADTLTARDESEYLGIRGFDHPRRMSLSIPAQQVAKDVRAVLNAWAQSADDDVTDELIRRTVPVPTPGYVDHVRDWVERMWTAACDVDSKVKFSHAHYLKLVSLMDQKFSDSIGLESGSVIMFDEAQDSIPAVTRIMRAQTDQQLIVVGDANQSINRFAGGIDQLPEYQRFDNTVTLPLSVTFRFGQRLADEANVILRGLGSPVTLDTLPENDTELILSDHFEDVDAVLTRNNAELLYAAYKFQRAGRKVAVRANVREIKQMTWDVKNLTAHPPRYPIRTPELKGLGPNELADWAYDDDAEPTPVRAFVRLALRIGPESVFHVLNKCVDEDRAEVTVSTVHKAKGGEWDSVGLAFREADCVPGKSIFIRDLFVTDMRDGQPRLTPEARDSFMLYYVALTRARKEVRVPIDVAVGMHASADTAAGEVAKAAA